MWAMTILGILMIILGSETNDIPTLLLGVGMILIFTQPFLDFWVSFIK